MQLVRFFTTARISVAESGQHTHGGARVPVSGAPSLALPRNDSTGHRVPASIHRDFAIDFIYPAAHVRCPCHMSRRQFREAKISVLVEPRLNNGPNPQMEN